MNTFCTIITGNYWPYAKSIYSSLAKFDSNVTLKVLICDDSQVTDVFGLEIFRLKDVVKGFDIGQKLLEKYAAESDKLRWSFKSVFIHFLLERGFDKVIFTDPDTYYFGDYNFLFQELELNHVILTPHWRGLDPNKDPNGFDLQFVHGLYNAGFIGVNKEGKECMQWWANACLYKCVIETEKGMYVDQVYLNLMPLYFDKVKIIKHTGCNVADWNRVYCERVSVGNKVFINGVDPIIFIHFTNWVIMSTYFGGDKLLKPYTEQYLEVLQANGLKMKDILEACTRRPSLPSRLVNYVKRRTSNVLKVAAKKIYD
jgi:hypothetical protein